MSRIFGMILAGGEASRLGGVRKGELRVSGERMIDRVARGLAGVEPMIVVATGQRTDCPLPPPAVAVLDRHTFAAGPLAGLAAAKDFLIATAAPNDILVSAAADTPFLPSNYVSRLAGAAEICGAAFAAWGDDFYPTHCAWRLTSLDDALAALPQSAGPRAALTLAGAERIDWKDESVADPFAGANTLAELLVLHRRAVSA